MRLRRYIAICFACIIILCIVCWLLSIVKCEILTYKYGEEFDQLWKEETMLINPEYWKVLKYRNNEASVYYVAPEGKGGTVLFFIRDEGEWKISGWGPGWSKYGTADDLIWPYMR